MGYSVKWVEENLGVTLNMLRYYEDKKLLSKKESRNSENNYRDYSDEDIEKIWGIKLLIGVGFSAKEIYAFMNDSNFEFDAAIAKKVAQLEREHEEKLRHLEFAKSIKFSGRIPTAKKVGSIRFKDFLNYCHENWNFYSDPAAPPFMQMADTIISKPAQEWTPEETERLATIFENLNIVEMIYACTVNGYYQVIADMRDLGHESDTVQRVVRLLHEYMVKNNTEPRLDGKITAQLFAKLSASCLINGDVAVLQEQNYGKEGCMFIAQALAYYGGLDVNEL